MEVDNFNYAQLTEFKKQCKITSQIHSHITSKLPHINNKYVEQFLPCEICNNIDGIKHKCKHGRLICNKHYKDDVCYQAQSQISPMLTFSASQIKPVILTAKKAKVCQICYAKSNRQIQCFMTTIVPIYSRSFYPIRYQDMSYNVVNYKSEVINHCCMHTYQDIIDFFSNPGRKHYLYMKNTERFFIKNELNKCTFCKKYCDIHITMFNIPYTSFSANICLKCKDNIRNKYNIYVQKKDLPKIHYSDCDFTYNNEVTNCVQMECTEFIKYSNNYKKEVDYSTLNNITAKFVKILYIINSIDYTHYNYFEYNYVYVRFKTNLKDIANYISYVWPTLSLISQKQ